MNYISFFPCFCFFETGDLCVSAIAVLELALVDQASLQLRDLPASASQVLGLKVCATTAQLNYIFYTIHQESPRRDPGGRN